MAIYRVSGCSCFCAAPPQLGCCPDRPTIPRTLYLKINLSPICVATATLSFVSSLNYWTTGNQNVCGNIDRPWQLFPNCSFIWHLNDSGAMSFLQCDPLFGFFGTKYFVAENEADLPP